MTDTEIARIIAILTPFALVLIVLSMIPLTRWQDLRWDQRWEAQRKARRRP